MSQRIFYISCTLLWVRIIPVKVDRSLTGIIRLYKNNHVKAKLFIQVFMHLCLVRLRLSCGRQKWVSQIYFFIILVVR